MRITYERLLNAERVFWYLTFFRLVFSSCYVMSVQNRIVGAGCAMENGSPPQCVNQDANMINDTSSSMAWSLSPGMEWARNQMQIARKNSHDPSFLGLNPLWKLISYPHPKTAHFFWFTFITIAACVQYCLYWEYYSQLFTMDFILYEIC